MRPLLVGVLVPFRRVPADLFARKSWLGKAFAEEESGLLPSNIPPGEKYRGRRCRGGVSFARPLPPTSLFLFYFNFSSSALTIR